MRRWLVVLVVGLALWWPLAGHGQSALPWVFHSGATATATGNVMPADYYSTIIVQLEGSFVGSVVFEKKAKDASGFVAVQCRNAADGTQATEATEPGYWECPGGAYAFQARVSEYTSGTIVVTGGGTTAVSRAGGGSGNDTLQTVAARGNTSTGNNETNPWQILGQGLNSGIGHDLFVTTAGDITWRCLTAAGPNKCNTIRQVPDGFLAGYADKNGTNRFLFDGATGAITHLTLDVTSANVAVTRKIVVTIPLASCPNGTAAGALNRPGNGATVPTPTCFDAGSIERPYLSFSGTAVNAGSITFQIYKHFTTLISADFELRYATLSGSPTGVATWDISTVCRGTSESIDGTFNAVQSINDSVGASSTHNDMVRTGLTMTGCGPGKDLTTLISRNGTSDTNNDAAAAFEATWTFIGVE